MSTTNHTGSGVMPASQLRKQPRQRQATVEHAPVTSIPGGGDVDG